MNRTWLHLISSTRRLLAKRFLIAASLCFGVVLLSPATFAQSPANNPNEMCGDGTTFTVNLPGTGLGIDDSDGIFRSVNVPAVGPDDSVTIPNGCSLYVLLVSGYHQNQDLDRITFFKVADFVAKHNGYVHVAWWNNLLKEYMGGPLHPATITIQRLFLPDLDVTPNPGGYDSIQLQAMLFPSDFVNLPKANPDENFQFISDATLVIQAIKVNNPNAIIALVGHSMGGDSVAWVGRNPQLPIDLLALIDPVNNRDHARGLPLTSQFNGTRWRSTHDFAGYKRWDCVRNSIGLCQNFDTRLFHFSFHCAPTGDFLDRAPLITTFAPLVCPYFTPFVDPGTVRTIGGNVKHLYFRWQHEYFFPFDYLADERYNYPAPLSSSILDPNYQQPILQNGPFEEDPNKTCAGPLGFDPRRGSGFACSPFDGHGEIVGFRAPQSDLLNPLPLDLEGLGLVMQNWPGDPAGRRAKMIEMTTPAADATWPQRPLDPDLCIVCDDIITILQNLINQQATLPGPPVTVATANPGPNGNGWNMQDVVVNLQAADNSGGSGVSQISYSAAGAQVIASTVVQGASTSITINTEGITTITFFATDNASNVESPKTLIIRLDKTPPTITAEASPTPNGSSWNNTNVTVRFPASDALSGLASSFPDVQVSTEGANQQIVGNAEDNAGNKASASVLLSIDKTPPSISCGVADGAWHATDVTIACNASDSGSGLASSSDASFALRTSVPTGTETASAPTGTHSACDLAGNCATAGPITGNMVDKKPPSISISSPTSGGSYLLNQAVNANYTCTDGGSGVATCTGSVANGSAIDTSSVGSKTFTVNGTDKVGNIAAPQSVSYSVTYGLCLLYDPTRSVQSGSTIPLKLQLCDVNNADASSSSIVVHAISLMQVSTNSSLVLQASGNANPDNDFRFDSSLGPTGGYIFNLSTKGLTTGSYLMSFTAGADPSSYSLMFQVR
jgi:hypothetical protein